jgi:hypothetical protein
MPYSYRIPTLLLILLVFLGAWYYAATLRAAPTQSAAAIAPKTSNGPTSIARRLRPPAGNPHVLADPFVPPAEIRKEPSPLVLPALPPPFQARSMPPAPAPANPPRPPTPPTAKPVPVPAPAPVLEPAGAPFKLAGIIMGDVPLAVLAGSNKAYVAFEGDEVEGWRVMRITETDVTLRSPTGEQISLTR